MSPLNLLQTGIPILQRTWQSACIENFPDTPPPMTFLREILQNSDDAGAKEMVIVFTLKRSMSATTESRSIRIHTVLKKEEASP